jgi:hypothetical protein
MLAGRQKAVREKSRRLDGFELDRVVATIAVLHRRIQERFPDRGLSELAERLLLYGQAVQSSLSNRKAGAIWRIVLGAFALAGPLALAGFLAMHFGRNASGGVDWSLLERGPWILGAAQVVVAGAYWTVVSVARRRALAQLHQLRGFAHIVDMHQLTRDPTFALSDLRFPAPSSPKTTFSTFELARYLDYCVQLMSLIGKLAVGYAEETNDQVVIAEASNVQSLVTAMTQNMLHKIVLMQLSESMSQGGPKV